MSTSIAEAPSPRIVPRPEHPISRRDISEGALKVLYRLHRSGYVAYLVGGAVRDLLLGRRPKDFDVATNARPREVRRLFRNSRIIGRRFRLVHVIYRDEIVEVSTFRAAPGEPRDEEGWDEARLEGEDVEEDAPEEERIYGTPAEDAWRRDFTVNALYYNIADFSVIDHVGGLEDLERRVIRTIGEPGRRFAEDPVRMMRALEYAVRLGFELDPATREAIREHRERIREAAPARLTYELGEALRSGQSEGIFRALAEFGLLELIHPEAAAAGAALWPILERLDRRVRGGERFEEVVLLGATLLPAMLGRIRPHLESGRRIVGEAVLSDLAAVLEPAAARMHLPNRFVHLLRHGGYTLTRLARPPASGRQVLRLMRREYFPVAWTLFELWVHAADGPRDAWKAWAHAVEQVRRHGFGTEPRLLAQEARRSRRRRGRRRRRR